MKKIILALLCLTISFGTLAACSKKENSAPENDRTVVLDEIGLTYTVPDAFREYEETNIVPLSLQGHYTFAEVIYLYVTPEDLQLVNDGEASFLTVGEPIFEIAVAKTESFEEDSHKAIFAYFNDYEVVGEQGEYSYYLFYNSKYAERNLEGEHLEAYNKLSQSIPELRESIETRDFDAAVLEEMIDFMNNYLTFETEYLEYDVPITSKKFADYDLCMVNFTASSAFPEGNEYDVLHSVNHLLKQSNSGKYSMMQVVLDSYDDKAVKDIIFAKEAAQADIIMLKADAYLSNWAKKNLNDLPATIFVDTDGKIVGETLYGPQTYTDYINSFFETLDAIENEE